VEEVSEGNRGLLRLWLSDRGEKQVQSVFEKKKKQKEKRRRSAGMM